MEYQLTLAALRDLQKLPPDVQKRIIHKLDFYSKQSNPLVFAKQLINHIAGQFRFRVGDYRIVFNVAQNKMVIHAIGHRRQIYKNP